MGSYLLFLVSNRFGSPTQLMVVYLKLPNGVTLHFYSDFRCNAKTRKGNGVGMMLRFWIPLRGTLKRCVNRTGGVASL